MAVIEHRTLGRDGPSVPVLGFGAWPIGGGLGRVEKAAAIDTVRAAIDAGITLIDTAEGYRTSEGLIGQALGDGYRERCFLATKASVDFTPRGIRRALENSLRALKVDHVDLYQVHSWNPAVPVEQSMEEMSRLKDEGKVGFIGVSNFQPEHMERALKVCRFVSNQVRYSLLFRDIEDGTVESCRQHGIGILVHSPLAKGLLTGRYTSQSRFPPDDERSGFDDFKGSQFARHLARADRLKALAEENGISLVQLAIAWTLRLPTVSCTLVGAKSAAQVAGHVGAAGVKLTPAELHRIDTILAG